MLQVLTIQDLQDFSKKEFPREVYAGDALFPNEKYDNFQFAWEVITRKSALPFIAQVSALDAEAPISRRPDAKRVEAETLFIKHKLNLTEHESRVKNYGVGSQSIKNYIFDDVNNLRRGVLARVEAMKMELIATGKISIKENNIDKEIDFEVPSGNIFAVDLTDEDFDFFAFMDMVKESARDNGVEIDSAMVSSRVLRLIRKNKGLQEAYKNSSIVVNPSEGAFINWFKQTFELTINVNNSQYTYASSNGERITTRFYPEDRITFLSLSGQPLGKGVFAPTPEEKMLGGDSAYAIENGLLTVTIWNEPDPAAQWTKVSASALPMVRDVNNVYIVYTN